jgi:hypothetical protein
MEIQDHWLTSRASMRLLVSPHIEALLPAILACGRRFIACEITLGWVSTGCLGYSVMIYPGMRLFPSVGASGFQNLISQQAFCGGSLGLRH